VKRILPLLLLGLFVGCEAPKPATGDPANKITWAEFEKMDPEQKADPYVVDNLDDEAKKKLTESQKKKKR